MFEKNRNKNLFLAQSVNRPLFQHIKLQVINLVQYIGCNIYLLVRSFISLKITQEIIQQILAERKQTIMRVPLLSILQVGAFLSELFNDFNTTPLIIAFMSVIFNNQHYIIITSVYLFIPFVSHSVQLFHQVTVNHFLMLMPIYQAYCLLMDSCMQRSPGQK